MKNKQAKQKTKVNSTKAPHTSNNKKPSKAEPKQHKNESSIKTKLKKIWQIVKKSLLALLILTDVFLFGSFINHRIQITKEEEFLANYNTGEIVEIDGKKVNYKIFNADKSNKTLVLMPGLNVQNLALLFKPLADKIDAKIVLINRPGYAFSEDTGHEADINYIVEYHRKVLKTIGIDETVILMPHSISGIYAMYWAEKCPDQGEGIIALDIVSP